MSAKARRWLSVSAAALSVLAGAAIGGRVLVSPRESPALTAPESADAAGVRELLVLATEAEAAETRSRAAVALRCVPADVAVPALRSALGEGDSPRRQLAIDELIARVPGEAVAIAATELRSNPDADARVRSVHRLGAIPGSAAAEALAMGLDDPAPAVRSAVCNVLREYRLNADGRSVTGAHKPFAPVFLAKLNVVRDADSSGYVRQHANCAINVLTDDRTPSCFRDGRVISD